MGVILRHMGQFQAYWGFGHGGQKVLEEVLNKPETGMESISDVVYN